MTWGTAQREIIFEIETNESNRLHDASEHVRASQVACFCSSRHHYSRYSHVLLLLFAAVLPHVLDTCIGRSCMICQRKDDTAYRGSRVYVQCLPFTKQKLFSILDAYLFNTNYLTCSTPCRLSLLVSSQTHFQNVFSQFSTHHPKTFDLAIRQH